MDSELHLFLQGRVVQSWVRIRLSKSHFFFLVGYAILTRDFVARSVAARSQALKLASLNFRTYESWTCTSLGYDNPGLVRNLNSDILFVYNVMIG